MTQEMRRRASLGEFARFVATGSLAAISNLLAVWAFQAVAPFSVAVVLGYIVGMIVAFILFQKTIFGDPQTPLRRRLGRFTAVNLLGLGLSWTISVSLYGWILPAIGWTFAPDRVANLIGVAAPAFSSYFLHKHYTYR
jgi:putative flippase GtrA